MLKEAPPEPKKISEKLEKPQPKFRRIIRSDAPSYSFFKCNDNYIAQVGSTSDRGILYDIDKRVTLLHNKYTKSGDTYFTGKEQACVGWAIRALGIIDDESLDATICQRRLEKKGLGNITTIVKLDPYFEGKLEKKTIREDIETLLEKMDPGHATIIFAKYNADAIKKLKDVGVTLDSHALLLIKTEMVEDPDNPDDPDDPGAYMIYDPSQFNPKSRLMYNGYDTSITVSEYLTSKTPFEKIAICIGRTTAGKKSMWAKDKLSPIAFGKKSKKSKKVGKKSKKTKKSKKSTFKKS
jgi:hypothetical protein